MATAIVNGAELVKQLAKLLEERSVAIVSLSSGGDGYMAARRLTIEFIEVEPAAFSTLKKFNLVMR